jgi:arginyl-tRNA synthetase
MVKDILEKEIGSILEAHGIAVPSFIVEKSATFGDYATNAALACAKELCKNPREVAELLVTELQKSDEVNDVISKIEIAGPGFINFYVKDEIIRAHVGAIIFKGTEYGTNETLKGQKVIVEYTDPNPFKEFHIGHLMSNAVGESLSRIVVAQGAEVKRACYQGDVGMHVAKAVWGMQQMEIADATSLGKAYAFGAQNYDEHKVEIQEINKKVYNRSDEKINEIYDAGRKISLEYFETIYKKLGTKFDYYFFESETGVLGKQIVEENLEKGIFEKSDGAVIFRGEDHGLHTRVFLNSEGLPTYEAKELGLAKMKYDEYPYDTSIVVTGNEVNDYFQVLLRAMYLIFPELEKRTKHISHGMLRLPTGKMSSRTGDVITAESLISTLEEMVGEKMKDRELEEKEKIAEAIAVGAIKYSILKQSPGKDIIFDFEKSLSFEGDSGVYLQYAYVRTQALLRKAGISPEGSPQQESLLRTTLSKHGVPSELEKLLFEGLPNVVKLAHHDLAPNYIATYLINVCRAFNAYYEQNPILGNEHTPYRLTLVEAVGIVLKNGLNLLGISAPERM